MCMTFFFIFRAATRLVLSLVAAKSVANLIRRRQTHRRVYHCKNFSGPAPSDLDFKNLAGLVELIGPRPVNCEVALQTLLDPRVIQRIF